MNDTVHFEKTLSSETLFEGRVITLTKDTALLENGKTATREVADRLLCAGERGGDRHCGRHLHARGRF